MGAMFRSEAMEMVQLFLQPESAYQCISELGEAGTVQFRDLNPDISAYQRKFVNEVRRCDEMERKLRYIEAEIRKDNVLIPEVHQLPKAPNPKQIIDLEAHLEKTEGDIRELNESAVALKSDFLQLTELKHVLDKTRNYFSPNEDENGLEGVQKALNMDDYQNNRGMLSFVAGVVKRQKIPAFERMLWRISRGNVFLRQAEIEEALEDPATGHPIHKTVFVVFFQGEQLKSRIKKVCIGFHASLYPCPSANDERGEMVKGVNTRIEDIKLILNQTHDHRQRVLVSVGKELQNWSVMVCKMKAIYYTLNFFNMDVSKKCLIGECWIPVKDIDTVQKALNDASYAGSTIPSFFNRINTNEVPPTFNRTNKFTSAFQTLIDAYGVASYREVNPALYTIVTFPFLFAVMFGDCGHGLILFLFALYMVVFEKQLQPKMAASESANIIFGGRYIILMMGLFSIYTGFIYNDVFSKSMNIFGSSWFVQYKKSELYPLMTLNPKEHYTDEPYFIGVDPVWQLAKNKIIFLNSYKMKLSIIFGVIHMIFGVSMGVANYVHFKKYSKIFLVFLPQLLFLVLLFFWMVVMMFMKFIMYGPFKTDLHFSTACAPSILIYFINMMLFKHTKPVEGCEEYMFSFQDEFQMGLVALAVLCIPVMLLGEPLYIFLNRRGRSVHATSNGDVNKPSTSQGHGHDDEPMSEIMINQAIHTVEYVLSTISHTASYLRLWALSLAHAQLSEVLWNMILRDIALKRGGYISAAIIFVLFGVWAVFTIGILVMMEGLSAFLHTLRLHWVEFMSKFYEGLGYPFEPFSFKLLMEQEKQAED